VEWHGTNESPSWLHLAGPSYGQHNDQTCYSKSQSHHGNDEDASSAGREFPSHDVVLAFEISMRADEQYDDGNGDEGGAQRFAHSAQLSVCRVLGVDMGQAGIEAEQLGDGYADAGEGERRA
jgi:hypothetical protein